MNCRIGNPKFRSLSSVLVTAHNGRREIRHRHLGWTVAKRGGITPGIADAEWQGV
jgi:hypothetical protein